MMLLEIVSTVQEPFEEHHKELKMPPDSPDLNLTEHLWEHLGSKSSFVDQFHCNINQR